MKNFEYIIKVNEGIHARPAGFLVNLAKKFQSQIIIKSNGKEESLKKLFALMKMGIKKDDTINVIFEGEDEEQAFKEVSENIKENF